MFFFVGGVGPKTASKASSLSCGNCGNRLSEVRVDHVLSAFFIPLWTVSTGKPFLACESCGWQGPLTSSHSMQDDGSFTGRGLNGQPQIKAPGSGWPREGREVSRDQHRPAQRTAAPTCCSGCGRTIKEPEYLFCPFCGTFLPKD